ncbi:hypothetical protein Tco_0497581 [Tanacetum coccineum]
MSFDPRLLAYMESPICILAFDSIFVLIPLEGDEIFRVHGKRTLGAAKALMNAKVDETRISDIPVLRGACPFLKVDFPSGYHQLRAEDAILRPQFKRDTDIVESTVMPFGLTNAPVVFRDLMNRVCKPYLGDALSRKERVKSRRVSGMMLAALSEAFKQENVKAAMSNTFGLLIQHEITLSENEMNPPDFITKYSKEWNSGDDQLNLRWMIYLVVLSRTAESVRDAIGFEYVGKWKKPNVERSDKRANVNFRRNSLESEVGERVLLKDLPWKGDCLVAYRLRLPEELNSVHDTFHVSNLKKLLGNANLHVPLNEIKIDKTLRFVDEPVEIMDREIKSLKRSRIPLVKVHWNSKRGPEFTWEREDYMKSKYPQLFVDHVVKPTS